MPGPVAPFNEKTLKNDLRKLVRTAVQDAPSGLLEGEADDPIGAERCERTADREAYCSGRCSRKPAAKPSEATIKMPKLRERASPPPSSAVANARPASRRR